MRRETKTIGKLALEEWLGIPRRQVLIHMVLHIFMGKNDRGDSRMLIRPPTIHVSTNSDPLEFRPAPSIGWCMCSPCHRGENTNRDGVVTTRKVVRSEEVDREVQKQEEKRMTKQNCQPRGETCFPGSRVTPIRQLIMAIFLTFLRKPCDSFRRMPVRWLKE